METILLKYVLCMMGVIGMVVLANILIWLLPEFFLTWREMKEKQKEGCKQQEKTTWLPTPPALLTPKECHECMLNHIEDGRFYTISSLSSSAHAGRKPALTATRCEAICERAVP